MARETRDESLEACEFGKARKIARLCCRARRRQNRCGRIKTFLCQLPAKDIVAFEGRRALELGMRVIGYPTFLPEASLPMLACGTHHGVYCINGRSALEFSMPKLRDKIPREANQDPSQSS